MRASAYSDQVLEVVVFGQHHRVRLRQATEQVVHQWLIGAGCVVGLARRAACLADIIRGPVEEVDRGRAARIGQRLGHQIVRRGGDVHREGQTRQDAERLPRIALAAMSPDLSDQFVERGIARQVGQFARVALAHLEGHVFFELAARKIGIAPTVLPPTSTFVRVPGAWAIKACTPLRLVGMSSSVSRVSAVVGVEDATSTTGDGCCATVSNPATTSSPR